jgi:Trypsin-co-occurring domain 1
MPSYIQFESTEEDGGTILIEVEEEDIEPTRGGSVKAGLKEDIANKLRGTISVAVKPFEDAIRAAVRYNVQGLISSVRALPDPPTEVEITFGLKATGEAGNIAVGKAGSEANYNVKLVWKQPLNVNP